METKSFRKRPDEKEIKDYKAEQELYERALNGDVSAQIEWLTKRKPDRWKNTPIEKTK